MDPHQNGGIDVILGVLLVLSLVAAIVTSPVVQAMPAARILAGLGALPGPALAVGTETVVMVDGP
jgi:hypothetical protein